MCRLATFDSPPPLPPPRRPAAPLACCLPAYFLTVIDSLLHTTLRDDAGALSCQALAIHFLKYACEKGEQRQRGRGGRRNGGRKPSGIITLATRCQACLPMPRLLLPAPAAAAACHIQHICNMYELCGISLQLALISFFSAS